MLKERRKRPTKLTLVPPSAFNEPGCSSRSMPSSPTGSARPGTRQEAQDDSSTSSRNVVAGSAKDLSSTLRGAPRRRPSMPFGPQAKQPETEFKDPGSSTGRPPEAFRDPSEHILSGKGSTLQHARSVYSQGPVEVLPGLFLGDEHNARDNVMLFDLGITTVLNVAKETTLPFQLEKKNSPLHSRPPGPWPPTIPSAAATPSSSSSNSSSATAMNQANRERKVSEQFFTPPTTAYPPADELDKRKSGAGFDSIPASPSAVLALLRNTSSTPNLLHEYNKAARDDSGGGVAKSSPMEGALPRQVTAQDIFRYRALRRDSSASSDEAYDTTSSPSSRAASTATSSATELTPPAMMSARAKPGFPSSAPSAPELSRIQGPDEIDITQVELPSNAIALHVPASPSSARPKDLRYIKLPWTHDETDLASAGGGFSHGCAIIAEALGIDSRVWSPAQVSSDPSVLPLLSSLSSIQTGPRKGKVLVHCQCGVSRSATLVIAFVMQAAALRYGFEESQALMGMHDCYNMVKEKSSSISPNISLIYQLVEWERQLSRVAGRLREALGTEAHSEQGNAEDGAPGWSAEAMDEAMWSRMRLQEEEKEAEAEEEQRRRDERLAEAKRAVAERKAAADRLEGRTCVDGVGASLMQRRRKAAVPSLQLKARPAKLELKSNEMPDTPFLTAKWTAIQDVEMTDTTTPTRPSSMASAPTMTGSVSMSSGLSRSRPGSMATSQVSTPTSGPFGAVTQSKEERRKQHRRTFSSDWPATLERGIAEALLAERDKQK